MQDDNGKAEMTRARVRILVAIDVDGAWSAQGDSNSTELEVRGWVSESDIGWPRMHYWVEADVTIPMRGPDAMIEGDVTDAE